MESSILTVTPLSLTEAVESVVGSNPAWLEMDCRPHTHTGVLIREQTDAGRIKFHHRGRASAEVAREPSHAQATPARGVHNPLGCLSSRL